jgi:hypothetical protein
VPYQNIAIPFGSRFALGDLLDGSSTEAVWKARCRSCLCWGSAESGFDADMRVDFGVISYSRIEPLMLAGHYLGTGKDSAIAQVALNCQANYVVSLRSGAAVPRMALFRSALVSRLAIFSTASER